MKHFKLFSDCVSVKGSKRSTICDLRRNEYYLIPNDLYDIIIQNKAKNAEQIEQAYNEEGKTTLQQYYSFLLENELGFWCDEDELELFPEMDLSWDYPAQISNCIIDIQHFKVHDFKNYFEQLESLGCSFIQVRAFQKLNFTELESVITNAENSIIKSIELHIQYESEEILQKLKELMNRYYRVTAIFIYSAPTDEIWYKSGSSTGTIILVSKLISSSTHCGIVHSDYFVTNIPAFSEALHHNSCLNRKISIDINGEIKNCPSMYKSYGNVQNLKLADAINNDEFKKLWTIKKDDIGICRDCEFRYICTDCRAYIEDPEDLFSKPLKCGYDPYSAKWEEWSINPLKQKAIKYYGE